MNKNTHIAPSKENLLRHNFASERGYVLEKGNTVTGYFQIYLSERVKNLVLEELTFIIVSTTDSELPSYRHTLFEITYFDIAVMKFYILPKCAVSSR